ncbi:MULTISPECIES: hypothetical protein [unclassified Methylobacterium]|nr:MULTISPECIES: hypothetical protein [unclassified Methylobacterium]
MAAFDMVIEPLDPGFAFAGAPNPCLIVQPIGRISPARRADVRGGQTA